MLSIVYITCNRCDELEKSIRSCEIRVSVEHEYIVIDNGSSDATPEYMSRMQSEGFNIKYFMQDKNYGVAGGRNIGFNKAEGDVCYFIDDDATVVSNGLILDSAYDFMINNSDVHAMGTDCYDTLKKRQLVGCPPKNVAPNSEGIIKNYLGGSHFIRKDAVKREFLYPDNLVYGAEELYAGLSFYKNGGKVIQYPNLKILHDPSPNTRMSVKEQKRNSHINTFVVKKYYLPFPYLLISKFMFFLRISRFERFNLKAIIKDYSLMKKRFDRKYKNKLTVKTTRMLVKTFGVKAIL